MKTLVLVTKKPEFVKVKKLAVDPRILALALLIRAAPDMAGAVATTARGMWSITDLVIAVVSAMLITYIGYMIVVQVKNATGVSLPGTAESMATMVWQFIMLMIFVAIASGMIGLFTGLRR